MEECLHTLRKITNFGSILLGILALSIVLVQVFGPKLGNTFSTVSNCPQPCRPDIIPTPIVVPAWQFIPPVTGGGSDTFGIVDAILRDTLTGAIAYNAPSEMEVGETVRIELLLNPSLSESELARQITDPGTIMSFDKVEIVPQMKAELISPNEGTFSIQPLHDSPIQLIGTRETTTWSWYITAKKGGSQKLTLVVYRLAKLVRCPNQTRRAS